MELVNVFPKEGLQLEVVNNDGVMALGDIVTGDTVLVEQKELYGPTSVKSSIFFHDPVTDQRTSTCETERVVDYFETTCTATITLTKQPTLSYSPSGLDIKSVSDAGKESVARIDVDGLSFNSDESAVMFGTTSQFRIKYDQNSDTIKIQFYDGQTYVTKAEYGR